MKIFVLTALFLLLNLSLHADKLPEKVEFNKHIRPLFSSTCFNCHGPDEHEVKGKLQLHTFEAATKKLGKKKNRQAIVPGKPEESGIWKRISTDDRALYHSLAGQAMDVQASTFPGTIHFPLHI